MIAYKFDIDACGVSTVEFPGLAFGDLDGDLGCTEVSLILTTGTILPSIAHEESIQACTVVTRELVIGTGGVSDGGWSCGTSELVGSIRTVLDVVTNPPISDASAVVGALEPVARGRRLNWTVGFVTSVRTLLHSVTTGSRNALT